MRTSVYFAFLFFTGIWCQQSFGQELHWSKLTAKQLCARISNPDTLYVVNFWATWCKPCVEELPAFDAFSVENKLLPVKVLLVSLDFEDEVSTRLLPFLKNKKVSAEVILLNENDPNYFVSVIEKSWTGAIPATLIIGVKKRVFYEKKLSHSDLEKIKNDFLKN